MGGNGERTGSTAQAGARGAYVWLVGAYALLRIGDLAETGDTALPGQYLRLFTNPLHQRGIDVIGNAWCAGG